MWGPCSRSCRRWGIAIGAMCCGYKTFQVGWSSTPPIRSSPALHCLEGPAESGVMRTLPRPLFLYSTPSYAPIPIQHHSIIARWVQSCISQNLLPGGGGGGIRNRPNLDWQNLPQQKCAKFCPGILRTKAIFLGVFFSAPDMHIPFVPPHFTLQGPFDRPVGGYCGLPRIIVHDS